MNAIGFCETCRHYRDLFCRNPESPYGGNIRLPVHKCFAHAPAKPSQEPNHDQQ